MATRLMQQTEQITSRSLQDMIKAYTLRWLPKIMLIVAAMLLVASISLPYWGMILEAPQYPGGLMMQLFVNRMEGNPDTLLDEVREIDSLNHYIGMRSMYDAAPIERAIAIPSIIIMAAALVIVALLHRRWLWLLALPAMLFPFIFLADLAFWLRLYGQNLDPEAPLSTSIRPFTPAVLGDSTIGQFGTSAYVDTGWHMALAASVLIVVALLVRLYQSRQMARGNN